MASGIILGTTSNSNIDSRIVWSSTADGVSRQSTVIASLYYKRNNTGFTTMGTGNFSLIIGSEKTSTVRYVRITEDDWVKVLEASACITHASDGSGAVSISGLGEIPETSLSSTYCSQEVLLDKISVCPELTLVSDAHTDGGECLVTVSENSEISKIGVSFDSSDLGLSFSLDLYFGASHVARHDGIRSGQSFPIPISDWLVFMPDHKNSSVLSDNEAPSARLSAYTSDGVLSGVSSRRFDICADPDDPSVIPECVLTLSCDNPYGEALEGLYIQGRSRIVANIEAQGKFGADITASYIFTDSNVYFEPYVTHVINKSGAVEVKAIVYDSRDIWTSCVSNVEFLPYDKPCVSPLLGLDGILCQRCAPDKTLDPSGVFLRLRCKRKYSPLIFDGEQKNFCELRYRFAPQGGGFSEWRTLIDKELTDTDDFDILINDELFAVSLSYTVEIGVIDSLGEYSSVLVTVPTDLVSFHLAKGGKGAAFGEYSKGDYTLSVGEKWTLVLKNGQLRLADRTVSGECLLPSVSDGDVGKVLAVGDKGWTLVSPSELLNG